MENNTRYIVVLFWDGVGYTYQTDRMVHVFFHHSAVAYKKLAYAKKCLRRLDAHGLMIKSVYSRYHWMIGFLVTNTTSGVRMIAD